MLRMAAMAALALVLAAPAAFAGDNDLILSRLGKLNAAGDDVIPQNQDFRSLASELGVALAPRFMAPADTLGYAGFEFSSELSYSTINATRRFWCATEAAESCDPGFSRPAEIYSLGVMVRKGIWLPVPSFEIGAGFLHPLGSRMLAAQVFGKLALHEGFHDWPLPSLAVRGAASRVTGTEQIDLTVASLDVSASKSFGVLGTINLSPYVGWNYLWIVARSQVIDETPEVAGDVEMNFVLPDQDNIIRQRVFGGLKLKYNVIALTVEVNLALAGESVDDRLGVGVACDDAPAEEQGRCDARDKAGAQKTLAAAVSFDF